MDRYMRCECGYVVRYKGPIHRAGKCPLCERWLSRGIEVTRRQWLEAHGFYVGDNVSDEEIEEFQIPTFLVKSKRKSNRGTTL